MRGEIWLVDLDPTIGNEIRKSCPCVVVSPAEMHDHLRTVIVAPMTTKSRPAPFRVPVTHGGQKGLILLDQMRSVDKTRLASKLGAVSAKTLLDTLLTAPRPKTEDAESLIFKPRLLLQDSPIRERECFLPH